MYQNIYLHTDRENNKNTLYIWDDKAGLIKSPYKPYAYRKKKGGKYKSIFGDELEKVTDFKYGQEGYFEADVPAVTRTLIDAYGESDELSTNHVIMTLDIETKTDGGFPKIDIAQQPITAIGFHINTLDWYFVYVLDESGEVKDYTDEEKRVTVFAFKTEEELILAFLDKYEELSPTIISGWNIDFFDMPYLYNRIKKVLGDKTAKRLSPIGIAHYQSRKGRMVIAGVSCLDYLALYKSFTFATKRLPNHRLDTVAYEELKMNKLHYTGSLSNLLRTDIKKFIEYNLNDIILVVLIDRKNKFIDLARALAHVGHIAYEDYAVSSRLLEGAILTYLRRNGLVAQNKSADGEEIYQQKEDEDEEGFEGAYVKEPIPGRYPWIFSCDINSLYPSVIMSLNISPETKHAKVDGWNTISYQKNELSSVTIKPFNFGSDEVVMDMDEFKKYITEHQLSISSNGILYDQNKDGLIKNILVKWYAERVSYKDKMKAASNRGDKKEEEFYKLRQGVQKILLNSLYGVLGLPTFRFYDLDNAEAVTLSGQDIIKTTEKFVNSRFNKICKTSTVDYAVYMDTDSCYVSAEPIARSLGHDVSDSVFMKKFTIDTASETAAAINDFYNFMMPKLFNTKTHRIKIAEDVIAKSAIWLAKKRYAMLKVYDMELKKDLDNKLDAKGIDIVRSSFPIKFKTLMSEMIMLILNDSPKKSVDKLIIKFKEDMMKFDVIDVAKNGPATMKSKKPDKVTGKIIDFNPEDRHPFSFIKGSLAQTKSALAYNDLLKVLGKDELVEPIYEGAKIKWVYLKKNKYGLDCIGLKSDGTDPKEIIDFVDLYTDREQIFKKELHKKLVMFYDAMKWEIYKENDEIMEQFFEF